jgi:hypothetical protein
MSHYIVILKCEYWLLCLCHFYTFKVFCKMKTLITMLLNIHYSLESFQMRMHYSLIVQRVMKSKNLTHKNVGFKRWWQKSSPNWGAKIEIHKNKGKEYVKPLDMLNIKITYRNIKCDTYVILEFWDLVPTLF